MNYELLKLFAMITGSVALMAVFLVSCDYLINKLVNLIPNKD